MPVYNIYKDGNSFVTSLPQLVLIHLFPFVILNEWTYFGDESEIQIFKYFLWHEKVHKNVLTLPKKETKKNKKKKS